MKGPRRKFTFIRTHSNLTDVLTDHDLASLGDAYVNFVCSLALSNRKGRPIGVKVKGKVLAEALKRAELRTCLPSRISQHMMADAAEALVVYAWLQAYLSIDETVSQLQKSDISVDGLTRLLRAVASRIKSSEGLF